MEPRQETPGTPVRQTQPWRHRVASVSSRHCSRYTCLECTASSSTCSTRIDGGSGSITRSTTKCFSRLSGVTAVHFVSKSFFGLSGFVRVLWLGAGATAPGSGIDFIAGDDAPRSVLRVSDPCTHAARRELALRRVQASQSDTGKVHITGPAGAHHGTCQSRLTLSMLPTCPGSSKWFRWTPPPSMRSRPSLGWTKPWSLR